MLKEDRITAAIAVCVMTVVAALQCFTELAF